MLGTATLTCWLPFSCPDATVCRPWLMTFAAAGPLKKRCDSAYQAEGELHSSSISSSGEGTRRETIRTNEVVRFRDVAAAPSSLSLGRLDALPRHCSPLPEPG